MGPSQAFPGRGRLVLVASRQPFDQGVRCGLLIPDHWDRLRRSRRRTIRSRFGRFGHLGKDPCRDCRSNCRCVCYLQSRIVGLGAIGIGRQTGNRPGGCARQQRGQHRPHLGWGPVDFLHTVDPIQCSERLSGSLSRSHLYRDPIPRRSTFEMGWSHLVARVHRLAIRNLAGGSKAP